MRTDIVQVVAGPEVSIKDGCDHLRDGACRPVVRARWIGPLRQAQAGRTPAPDLCEDQLHSQLVVEATRVQTA